MEQVGGSALASLPPAAMSSDALAKVEARLKEPRRPGAVNIAPTVPETEIPGLPKFVRRYGFGNWKWIAPSVHVRPTSCPMTAIRGSFCLSLVLGLKCSSIRTPGSR